MVRIALLSIASSVLAMRVRRLKILPRSDVVEMAEAGVIQSRMLLHFIALDLFLFSLCCFFA